MAMPTLDPGALERAFDLAARQVADGTTPWAVLGVGNGAGVVRLEATPGAAGSAGASVTTDSICLLASITKPIVATVVFQLVAEGRLTLTEPIERFLPEAADPDAPPITAWHLLSHASGLADLDIEGLLGRGSSHAEAVERLLREPRVSPPGSTFRYATSPFDLLGALITAIDGRPYPEAIRARLLEPLGMSVTSFDPRAEHGDRVVLPLTAPLPHGGAVPGPLVDAFIAMAMPGAALWSSASDLLRFGRAMVRGGEIDGVRVLPPAFVDLMTRETTVDGIGRTDDPLTTEHYALGWGKPGPASPGDSAAFFHGGITGTRLWVDPANDLVVVYLTGAWEQPTPPVDAVLNVVYAALR
jgi:CubicO group peptidase (beta-lactamase class C family)